jgi:hypothetical protein
VRIQTGFRIGYSGGLLWHSNELSDYARSLLTGWVTSSFSRKTVLCKFVCLLFSQSVSQSARELDEKYDLLLLILSIHFLSVCFIGI